MATPIEELIKVRVEKSDKLKQLGVNPYSFTFDKKHSIDQARQAEGNSVQTAGRIMAVRGHGAISFLDLVDETGKIQLLIKADSLSTLSQQINEFLDIGDIIGVSGLVFTTKTGELTIEVKELNLLTKSVRPLPSTWHGLKDVEERYRQRYVDLVLNPDVRRVFNTRTRIVSYLRRFLDEKGFLEVETPVLQPLYGGATARPFITHHNALDNDFYLRISDELYLKRLIVGGYDKVYEMSKDFRNEGIDRQHNPEFTMLEFYWAYADYTDLMILSEEMLSGVVKEVTGSYKIIYQDKEIDFTLPWPRVKFRDLVLKDTGVDIDEITTEEKLCAAIKEKNLNPDLKGISGYANVLDELYKAYSRPNITGPIFLIDHPYEAMPLAKRLPDDQTKIASMQLLVCGFEVIKAYSELNDPTDQRARWEEEKVLVEKGVAAQPLDEDYIRALEYGMPPTAGWGMGIDRFTAILTNQASLKDVILFPTLKPEKKIKKVGKK